MTGTYVACLHINQSQSYLNHLVHTQQVKNELSQNKKQKYTQYQKETRIKNIYYLTFMNV
jgi:hypothetical protein